MKGILNVFKNMGRVADGKAQDKADKIESENSVTFGKQDVAKMNVELGKVNENIGTMKGEIAVLEDKVKGIKLEIKKHESDATELAEDNEALALKHCEAAERLESQLEPLQAALTVQKETLAEQQSAKEQLKSNVMQAESDLVTLKAMADAASANEKLVTVNTSGSTSAVADFAKRKEDMKKRLIKSRAMKDEGSGDDDLAKETAAALGTGGGASRLEMLKAKNKGSGKKK
jgi:phage shock protein A